MDCSDSEQQDTSVTGSRSCFRLLREMLTVTILGAEMKINSHFYQNHIEGKLF